MRALRLAAGVALAVVLALLGARFAGSKAMSANEPDSLAEVAARFPGRTLQVDGHAVHVVEQGSGPLLLLVHGFGASTYDFEQHVLGPLSETHRVVAVDLFGMGLSERRADFPYDFAGWADQLAGTLDALGAERAIVAGHSMGGAVASVFAVRHPERVAGLVLIGALYPSTRSETPWIFLALRTPLIGELGIGLRANLAPPHAPADYLARMAAVSRIAGTRAAMIRYIRTPGKFEALEAAYPKLRMPTLILHGSEDANVSHAAMLRAAPKIRGANVVTLEGKGHFLLWEAPERVVAELQGFSAALD